jgi:hypothetical protein
MEDGSREHERGATNRGNDGEARLEARDGRQNDAEPTEEIEDGGEVEKRGRDPTHPRHLRGERGTDWTSHRASFTCDTLR